MHALKTSKARENILRRIRASLQEGQLPLPYPELENQDTKSIFHPMHMGSLEETFAYEFSKNGGHFIYCADRREALANFKALVEKKAWTEVMCTPKKLFTYLIHKKNSFIREYNPLNRKAGIACISECELAVARTGTIVLSSLQNSGRIVPVTYPVQIYIVTSEMIVENTDDAMRRIVAKYGGVRPSLLSFVSGPGKTTSAQLDPHQTGQGVKEIFCFFIQT